MFESARNFAQRNMRGHERDRDFPAGQTHREIFHATALGKKFRLPGKLEPRFVHPRFVNGASHDCVNLAAARARDRFFERSRGPARSSNRRRTRFAIGLPADHDVFG